MVIAVVATVGAVLATGFGGPPAPSPFDVPSPQPTRSASSDGRGDEVVDERVVERGWVPEPISRDPDAYARAALEAAGTFDTRSSSRDEWLDWLDTWFTPSPLYTDEQDAQDQLERYRAEMRNSVTLPEDAWDDLASTEGRVAAHVVGEIEYLELPETTAAHMWTATADVVLTYTRLSEGEEVSYDEPARVSVQVVCEGDSIPAPNSSQRPGDCKVVRYFDQAVG